MSYRSTKLPLLLERAGVRGVKSSIYIPLIPAWNPRFALPLEKEQQDLCRYLCPLTKGESKARGPEGDLFKKSPLTPLFQRGELA